MFTWQLVLVSGVNCPKGSYLESSLRYQKKKKLYEGDKNVGVIGFKLICWLG